MRPKVTTKVAYRAVMNCEDSPRRLLYDASATIAVVEARGDAWGVKLVRQKIRAF
jgi:hypothetical protein